MKGTYTVHLKDVQFSGISQSLLKKVMKSFPEFLFTELMSLICCETAHCARREMDVMPNLTAIASYFSKSPKKFSRYKKENKKGKGERERKTNNPH